MTKLYSLSFCLGIMMHFLRLVHRLFFSIGNFPASFPSYLILLHIDRYVTLDLFANETMLEEIATPLSL